ncbi:MAG: pilus assembly FimT family protein [Janthinobacterium lividum]
MSATGDGFTLIEMLVVLAIMGLIAGLGFPRLERAIATQDLRRTGSEVAAALRAARARALRTGSPAVFVAGPGSRFWVGGEPAQTAPVPVTVEAWPRGRITFFGDGSSSGGTATVAGPARRLDLVVEPATGLFRVVGR